MRENLGSSNSYRSSNDIYSHSLNNPTFYITNRRLKQESESFGENNEGIKENVNKFLDSRSFTSGSDNRNKLLRESFI